MAKGYDNHQQRRQAVSLLGKDLARRCKSSCELCAVTGESLSIYEVPPVAEEPELEACIMICSNCRLELERPQKLTADRWRCLNTAIWSEVSAVQVVAFRLLEALQDHRWAVEVMEQSYLDPEVESWARMETL